MTKEEAELQTQLEDNEQYYAVLLDEYNRIVKLFTDMSNEIQSVNISDELKNSLREKYSTPIRIFV